LKIENGELKIENEMNYPKPIGKVVKSNTHIDYVCQVYNPGEIDRLPEPTDYTFGTFVTINLEESMGNGHLIGVIYNTLLMNPDFGNLGPRLSSRQELEVFTPDYLAETATLLGIIALGWQGADGGYHQGIPALAATVNAPVYQLDSEMLSSFHQDQKGRLALSYVPLLMSQNNPLVPQLLLNIVDRLTTLFPEQKDQLAVMRNNLAWKSIVMPVG